MSGDRPDGGFFGDGGPGDGDGVPGDGASSPPGPGGSTPPPPPPPPPGGTPPPPPPPGGAVPSAPGSPPGGWGRRIIPLHPLTVGDILDGAFKLYRGTAAQVSIAVVIVFGFLQLISSLAVRDAIREPFAFDGTGPTAITDVFPVATIVTLVLTGLVTLLVTPLVNGAVTWIAARYDLGEDRQWDEGYRAAWSRFGALLGTALLVIAIAVGLLLVLALVIGLPAAALGQGSPGLGILLGVVGVLFVAVPAYLVLFAVFYVVVPAIMVEGLGAVASLRRSYQLLRPQLFRTIGLVVLAALLIGLVQGVVGGAFGLLSFVAGPIGWIIEAIGNTLVQMVTVPIAANIALLIYVDARIRTEGFDIEMMADGLPSA